MAKKHEMSDEEREWLRDAKTPTEAFDQDAYINGPPVQEMPQAAHGAGWLVPKSGIDPDPLSDDWLARRIEFVLGDDAKSLNQADRDRMEAVRDPYGRTLPVMASNGRRGVSLFRKVLAVFEGYGLKKVGAYDEVNDTVILEVSEAVAKMMIDLGFSLKFARPAGDDGSMP